MKLSTRSRYGLRILIELARRGGGPAQLGELAAAQEVPHAYASKLVEPLKAAGILASSRGSGGGVRLARTSRSVSALEAVEALEGGLSLVDCSPGGEPCPRGSTCPSSELWRGLEAAMKAYLAERSLESLAAAGPDPDYCI